jgi:hypothetical protein
LKVKEIQASELIPDSQSNFKIIPVCLPGQQDKYINESSEFEEKD